MGDLDGDGVTDLAVGANGDSDGGPGRGAAWILFLNVDGTVKGQQKISDTQGGFTGTLDDSDWFGFSGAGLGDLDGDGVVDLAVGAALDDDGGLNRGAVWVLFLNANGTVKSWQKISNTQGNFTGVLTDSNIFGSGIARIGDLNGDGVSELAIGAQGDDDGFVDAGAVWTLFLNPTPTANQAPTADAGFDQLGVECTAPSGATVTLDGSGSTDPDSDPLTYTWTGPFPEGAGTVTGVNPTVTLAPWRSPHCDPDGR